MWSPIILIETSILFLTNHNLNFCNPSISLVSHLFNHSSSNYEGPEWLIHIYVTQGHVTNLKRLIWHMWHFCDIVTWSQSVLSQNELEIRFFFFLNRSKSRRAALASCKSGSALIQKMDYHENRSRDIDHVIPSVEGIMWQKSNMKPYSKISFEMCEIVKIENSSVHMVISTLFMAMLPLSFDYSRINWNYFSTSY